MINTKKTLLMLIGFIITLSVSHCQDEMDNAIASLRHIHSRELSEKEKKAKIKIITKAWDLLLAEKDAAYLKLRKEIEKIDQSPEKDDFFKLSAGALFWEMKGIEAGEEIGALFESSDLTLQYNYVFQTAFSAAITQDPKALPILKACLKNKKSSYFVPMHFLDIKWPLSIDFLWGAYGSKGLPALMDVIKTSDHAGALESAIHLLTKAMHTPALPQIRELTQHKNKEVRTMAIRALGEFGHPTDYEFLISGLKNKDPLAYVYALVEFQDLRAVKQIAPLIHTESKPLKDEVFAAFSHLMNPDALKALRKYAPLCKTEKEKKYCEESVTKIMEMLELDWESFMAKSAKEQDKLILNLHDQGWNRKYGLRDDDKKLTHGEFIKAARQWIKANRITGGDYEWVEDRHVLHAASEKDIPLLLDVRAACYARLSDECLYEVRILDRLVKWLGRSAYRKKPAVCLKAEPIQ